MFTLERPLFFKGQLFRCDAKIVDFANELLWFKRGCLVLSCREHVSPTSNKFFCVPHGVFESCRYLFMPTVTLGDSTPSASAMLFDDVVRSIIGQSCADLISYIPTESIKKIPEVLLSARDATFTFYLKIRPHTKTGVTNFSVDGAEAIETASASVTPHTPMPTSEMNRQSASTGVKRTLFEDTGTGKKHKDA